MRIWTAPCALLVAATPLFAAASGKVVNTDGKPIPEAEVCTIVKGATGTCNKVDALGFYHVAKPPSLSLFVRASGYQPLKIAAIEQSAPIVLERAAILRVEVLDAATRRPVPKGKVILNYASGEQIGAAAPFNSKGVRITTLAPGEILIRAEADGYENGGPEAVTAIAGKETGIAISMKKVQAAAR